MKLPPFLCPLGYDRNGVFVMKYTLKEKLWYVKKHLEENVPLHEIERKYGLKTDPVKLGPMLIFSLTKLPVPSIK